ncbi:L-threonylcarbamoyladenylate synthase [Rathayibacter soli]|uniref:L-threonylcarbamoyladenylate synthase n=1 Tax=Rathayibacter soli TaxID=3144168 RepID=UPI0027E5865F|nr:L-threonylcarbamoyladenylate synthase [Glaciibacter superstes]
MPSRFDLSNPAELLAGTNAARTALRVGKLVVVPTDTVYGVAADAFSPTAVQALLDAKGRTRQAPPPVLIPGKEMLDLLAVDVPEPVRRLVDEFWPGGLTVILRAQPALSWDLGETHGTVGLRMPAHDILLGLLHETGPLAVSSANRTGQPSALNADEAEHMLGDSVTVYLDGGSIEPPAEQITSAASTIVDAAALDHGGTARILRHGPVPDDAIARILGQHLT